MIIIKSDEEIKLMRKAGQIVAKVLEALVREIKPGMTTSGLDALAAEELEKYGAVSSFKGYQGFPGFICTSVNEEVVHGVPGNRALWEGDLISLDVGAFYQGFHGDAAITVGVGKISALAQRLIQVTRGALEAGIAAAKAGAHLSDISFAIQSCAESNGFSPVREYVGHGIGREMHEEPQIPNFGPPEKGPLLRQGMTLAPEPMINAGSWKTRVCPPDQWTVVTADGGLSAHFEHTIVLTDRKAEVLTQA